MSNTLIVIVGMPGSGKTFAGSVLKKRFNALVLETGDIIREEIKKRGWKYTPETDKKIRNWFHPGREHIIVERLVKKLKKSRKRTKVIVGFRCLKEIKLLKKLYKEKIIVIAIISSFKIRAHREIRRKRFGKSESLEYLSKRDTNEKRIGLAALIKHADFKINNSKLSKKQMETRLVKLVNSKIIQI